MEEAGKEKKEISAPKITLGVELDKNIDLMMNVQFYLKLKIILNNYS